MKKHKVAVLISGSGSNLQALLDACNSPDYPAQIALVISNKADAYGVVRAKNSFVPVQIISHKDFASREEFDAQMHNVLLEHEIEFICLAGFMRLLSAGFVENWRGKMLNIHPSLLPNFKGGNAVRDALAAGATQTGCTVHLVTEEMDAGEIIAQAAVPILNDDTLETLLEKIHRQEHLLYPLALKKLLT